MQKFNNLREFPCIFEQKTISEQIELILAHFVLYIQQWWRLLSLRI